MFGTKREWCPVCLVVLATLRRSGRAETLIGKGLKGLFVSDDTK